ncbi:MAG: methylated-DNA--[protein]-cysteine S-methyltransferase [Reyranella sp.]|uniref:methylated-DNA--[protein]-cysteine S-methyltransferase n=1 Tax=Reyranella sp. TaxID=1929291 RepID=UPI003D150F41
MTTSTATAPGFALFETPLGVCGIAWNANGITGLQLPEASAEATRTRLRRRWPGAHESEPPADVQRAIDRVLALLGGAAIDLSDVALDLDEVPEFHRKVYAVARTIPPGRTLTYGDIARRLGVPQEAREVGQALGRNPVAIIVPCHRVLAANGRMGGFSANGGVATKRRMLEIEGALDSGPLFEFARR